MSQSARISEAVECEKKASECLKTSMIKLKFKPDYDSAATLLERAAVCYRNAGNIDKSIEANKKAAEYHEQAGHAFHAAKARENAGLLLREANRSDDAFKMFQEAIEGYAVSGSMDTAAMTVEKAAKVISQSDPEKAIELYERGLTLVQQSDRSKMAGEFLSQITRLNLSLEKYPEAAKAIRDEIEKYVEVKESPRVGQLAIGLVLVGLAQEDSVAATKYYGWSIQQCPTFEFTDDARVCQQLIRSYEDGDDDVFQNVLKCGALKSMDNEYLRLQRKLKVPSANKSSDVVGNDEDDEDLR